MNTQRIPNMVGIQASELLEQLWQGGIESLSVKRSSEGNVIVEAESQGVGHRGEPLVVRVQYIYDHTRLMVEMAEEISGAPVIKYRAPHIDHGRQEGEYEEENEITPKQALDTILLKIGKSPESIEEVDIGCKVKLGTKEAVIVDTEEDNIVVRWEREKKLVEINPKGLTFFNKSGYVACNP